MVLQRFLLDPASASLTRALDGYATRQRVVANNIANADTPGFTRSAVSFESQLKSALGAGNSDQAIEQIGQVQPDTTLDQSNPARPDGNNVNMEQEVADLSKTNLSYRATTILLEMKGAMLKTAITEGRR